MDKRAAIYVRVSTDGQPIENQLRELRQIAERRGWEVVHEYHDAGIEGAGSPTGAGRDAERRFDVTWQRLPASLVTI
jgi:DNA invertase Pin-like site-specific DNA recombinase